MSWAEDIGYTGYEMEDLQPRRPKPHTVLKDGKVQTVLACQDCGSINVKYNKDNLPYCADLCWVKEED